MTVGLGGLGGRGVFCGFGFVMAMASDYDDEEIVRRSEAALMRALSTPHKRQSEMKLGKPRTLKAKANQKRSAFDASRQADAPASQEASKP